ncbi:MAG: TlpA disulfide reductase family protein, partial [Planctomycetota bacterium]|nr:TlpA disulfide reductase family protein [Planctomycetota bacterium]
GKLHVDRSVIRRMIRWNGGDDLLFFGPNGLQGWQTEGPANAWQQESGHLSTNVGGAILRRDFAAPAKACFEFEISWQKRPEFALALGVGADPKSFQTAFRFEVWQSDLVAIRETADKADVAALQLAEPAPNRAHLLAYLDQEAGRMLIYSSHGKKIATLNVPQDKPQTYGGLQLINNAGGDIRLEKLRISRWNGELPGNAQKSNLQTADGIITAGELKSFDGETQEFILQTDDGEKRLPLKQVRDAILSGNIETQPRPFRAVHLTGARVGGQLQKVEAGKLWLQCPGIQEPLAFPIDSLQSLAGLNPAGVPSGLTRGEGRLETAGAMLHGNLSDATEGETSCLHWKPRHSTVGTPLAKNVSAKVVYRDVPPKPAAQNQAYPAPPGLRVRRGVVTIRSPVQLTPPHPANSSNTTAMVHLRSGDTLPGQITSMDEEGIHFTSSTTTTKFIPHAQIQAVELMPNAPPIAIPRTKKDRLLTLPRMDRNDPPTHLIRSVTGDYLRGRLLSMDKDSLTIEVRLDQRTVKRNTVARIIWLHPELNLKDGQPDEDAKPDVKPEPDKKPDAVAPPAIVGTRVQTIPSDSNRLTFVADKLTGTVLSGRSELLGECKVDLKQIDQLLIGPAIEAGAANLAFHGWKLIPALDPLEPPEPGSGDGSQDGRESPLVGKPAPAVTLDLVDGGKFNLADQKGNIIILDFWASWCGPCLQVMPQIHEVAGEFADQKVQLVGVNLQETPDRIKGVLERLKLELKVALDSDGLVAERYGATAIPQTVIIDRDGKVARLFVGGGARFDEQLRTALKQVISGEEPPAAADATPDPAKPDTTPPATTPPAAAAQPETKPAA